MSLETVLVYPFRYALKCQPRDDLDLSLGSLPNHTVYIGSSNNISQRLCVHAAGKGSGWTKRFAPLECIRLDIERTDSAKECLAREDNMVIDQMFRFMQEYTHPQAWRCVGGGSWAQADRTRMPWPLQLRLRDQGSGLAEQI